MVIYTYKVMAGEPDRLWVDEELATYIQTCCSGHKFNMYYDAVKMQYEVSCGRELANRCIEVCNRRISSNRFSLSDAFSATIQEATDDLYSKIFGKEEPTMSIKYTYNTRRIPVPVKIINQGPATIVFWDDKTKTVVKCSGNDQFDVDMAITMACLKKMVGDEAYAKAKQMGHKKKTQSMIEWKY